MESLKALTGKLDDVYYSTSGLWSFMPLCHRPEGDRPLHDDWPRPFSRAPRTYTSFLFIDAEVVEGDPGHWFTYNGGKYPKPYCLPGHHQKTKVIFKCPVTGKIFEEIYYSRTFKNGWAYRYGARISDDYVNGEVRPYVNFLRGPRIFTFGTKKINEG